jgi:hypothetical protein
LAGLRGLHWTRALRSEVSGRLATEFRLAGDVPGGMADYRLALVIGFFHRFFADVECSLGKETNFAKETSGKEVEGTNCDERQEDAENEECPPAFKATQIYQAINRFFSPYIFCC